MYLTLVIIKINIMKSLVEKSIEILKDIVKDDTIETWKKNSVFNSFINIFEHNQNNFANWILLFIENHKFWLVHSKYSNDLVNVFEDDFQESLDKLEEKQFKQLIRIIKNKKVELKGNISVGILFHEAIHFGYIEPPNEELAYRYHPYRPYNKEIKKVYEIHFPHDYKDVFENYKRMIYFNYEDENYKYEFDDDEFDDDELEEIKDTHRFGGIIEGLEAVGINRIITIDPIPNDIGVSSVKKITIGFNFKKAFWIPIDVEKPYYIKHNSNGEPVIELTNMSKDDIEFYMENPLKECKVLIKETPKKYIHHAISNNEWRIGGMPLWIQEPETVCCIECGKPMMFFIQLPSDQLIDIKKEPVTYGNCGMTYGFWCDKDRIMAYIWQDT